MLKRTASIRAIKIARPVVIEATVASTPNVNKPMKNKDPIQDTVAYKGL